MLTTLALLSSMFALQNGDKDGEVQEQRYLDSELAPSPILTAAEQLKTFNLKDGYKIELVAAEPLVVDPVIAMWDEHQRLWVVEMTTYMLEPTGAAESDASCCVAVITDSDGDGVLDTRTEYLNNLILPRGIVAVKEGMLILSPPNLLLCEDTDGDLVADQRTIIKSGFEIGIASPEHAPNNMLRSLDNYIYLAKHNERWKWQDGKLSTEPNYIGAQWGLAEDRYGRKFYNHNSHPMFFDKLPAHYFAGKEHDFKSKVLQQSISAQRPHPARQSFGVNRAYRSDTLDSEGFLQRWTGCCGPYVEGESVINAYNCEPCGNLIHCTSVTDSGAVLEEFELLTSTDERFRPVNMFGGPEDAIYVVDMNRGLFQHKLFLTSYLREYSEKIGLDKTGSTGRIWKISKTAATQRHTNVSPGDATPAQLVELLSHPNKWYRDTAQRLLVDGGDLSAVTIAALRNSNSIHAARTLEAHGWLKAESILVFLESDNQQQQILGLQLMASVAAENNSQIHRAAQRIHDAGGLSAWQNTLTGDSGTATANLAPSAPDVFMQTCASCHNTDARGIDKLAPTLVGSVFLKGNDDILHKIITDGHKTMPPITTLNQDQQQEIIDYLRTL